LEDRQGGSDEIGSSRRKWRNKKSSKLFNTSVQRTMILREIIRAVWERRLGKETGNLTQE
jgi:hypothetical protein